jgi:hypothetical protein
MFVAGGVALVMVVLIPFGLIFYFQRINASERCQDDVFLSMTRCFTVGLEPRYFWYKIFPISLTSRWQLVDLFRRVAMVACSGTFFSSSYRQIYSMAVVNLLYMVALMKLSSIMDSSDVPSHPFSYKLFNWIDLINTSQLLVVLVVPLVRALETTEAYASEGSFLFFFSQLKIGTRILSGF